MYTRAKFAPRSFFTARRNRAMEYVDSWHCWLAFWSNTKPRLMNTQYLDRYLAGAHCTRSSAFLKGRRLPPFWSARFAARRKIIPRRWTLVLATFQWEESADKLRKAKPSKSKRIPTLAHWLKDDFPGFWCDGFPMFPSSAPVKLFDVLHSGTRQGETGSTLSRKAAKSAWETFRPECLWHRHLQSKHRMVYPSQCKEHWLFLAQFFPGYFCGCFSFFESPQVPTAIFLHNHRTQSKEPQDNSWKSIYFYIPVGYFLIGGKTELLHATTIAKKISEVHNVQMPPVESFEALLTIASSTKSDQPTDLAHRRQIPQPRTVENELRQNNHKCDTIHTSYHSYHLCFLAGSPTWTSLGPGKKRCKNCMGGPDWDCINLRLKFQDTICTIGAGICVFAKHVSSVYSAWVLPQASIEYLLDFITFSCEWRKTAFSTAYG